MKEIRIHGSGGMGTAMASEILSNVFLHDGMYASSFPMFGAERRGAPVSAFLRFDHRPIRVKTRVYDPDAVMIFDPKMHKDPSVYAGLKTGGVVLLNHEDVFYPEFPAMATLIGVVDATNIALRIMGRAIPNTCMIGAFSALTEWISFDGVMAAIGKFFSGDQKLKNRACAQAGFEEVRRIVAR
jgi:pyruvate ferredoxin oxidoreductase gamma subunit